MAALLSAVESAQSAKPVSEVPLHDRLRELVATFLTDDDRVVIRAADPVGGGTPCSVSNCPRPQVGQHGICKIHFQRWKVAGKPDPHEWNPGPCPEPLTIALGKLPVPLRWEIAYGIDQADAIPILRR